MSLAALRTMPAPMALSLYSLMAGSHLFWPCRPRASGESCLRVCKCKYVHENVYASKLCAFVLPKKRKAHHVLFSMSEMRPTSSEDLFAFF